MGGYATLCLMSFYGVVVIVCSLAFKRGVDFITCFPGALYMRDLASCLLFRLVWLTDTYCMQVELVGTKILRSSVILNFDTFCEFYFVNSF